MVKTLLYLLSVQVHADGHPESGQTETMDGRKKFQKLAQHVILYVGSQRGTIDQVRCDQKLNKFGAP